MANQHWPVYSIAEANAGSSDLPEPWASHPLVFQAFLSHGFTLRQRPKRADATDPDKVFAPWIMLRHFDLVDPPLFYIAQPNDTGDFVMMRVTQGQPAVVVLECAWNSDMLLEFLEAWAQTLMH